MRTNNRLYDLILEYTDAKVYLLCLEQSHSIDRKPSGVWYWDDVEKQKAKIADIERQLVYEVTVREPKPNPVAQNIPDMTISPGCSAIKVCEHCKKLMGHVQQ